MLKIPTVLLTAALAIGLAVVAVNVLDDDGASASVPELPDRTLSGRTPAFHLRATPTERRQIARECLDALTSAQAKVLGTVKDDLALLADDREVVSMVLEDFAQRRRISKFESAAFADLFSLVKHRDFAEAGLELTRHEEFAVRHKTIAVAATQRDPRYVARLTALFEDIEARKPGEGMRTLELILHAARACGGDDLPALLDRALRCKIPQIRDVAAAIIREDGMTGLKRLLRPLLDDEMSQPRLQAAWGLASFGDPKGAGILLREFDPRNGPEASFILEAARGLVFKEAIPVIKARLDVADPEMRSGMLLTLAFLGDAETNREIRKWAYDDDASVPNRIVGLMALAALGVPEDDQRLIDVVRTGGSMEALNISRGLVFRDRAPDLSLAEALISSGHIQHTAMIEGWLSRMNSDFVPWLLGRLDEATDVNQRLFAIGCLGLVGTHEAREAILSRWREEPRLVEEQIRLLDLARRKGVEREG